MNKILILVVGILLVASIVSSIAFGLNKADFTENVDKINAKKVCDKMSEDKKDKYKKCKDKDYEVDMSDSDIEIKQNPEGILMVQSK